MELMAENYQSFVRYCIENGYEMENKKRQKKEIEEHDNLQKQLRSELFCLSMIFERLTFRRKGEAIKQLANAGIHGITYDVLFLTEDVSEKKPSAKTKTSVPICKWRGCNTRAHSIDGSYCFAHLSKSTPLCIRCNKTPSRKMNLCYKCMTDDEKTARALCIKGCSREARSANACCTKFVGTPDRCLGCGERIAKTVGHLCWTCFEAQGGIREKCIKCNINLARKKKMCLYCIKNERFFNH